MRFDNLEHLSSLSEADYLTLRLYANNDSNNILWEYAFGRGLLVSYQLLHEEHFIAPVDGSDEAVEGVGNDILYRLLGGVRLKYTYELPPQAEPISYTWEFTPVGDGGPGRFCADHYSASTTCQTATTRTGADLASVYWEPADWSTGVNYNGTLIVRYTLNGGEETDRAEFRVASRELKPAADGAEPKHGSDVAMLEEMLWELGLSPQMPSPGGLGARIGSNRAGEPDGVVNTLDCDQHTADDRSVFYKGFVGCPANSVSLELMLRRLQARNNSTDRLVYDRNLGQRTRRHDLADQTGVLDADTLADLKRDWVLYYMRAYREVTASDIVTDNRVIDENDPRINTWLENAVAIWENGFGTRVPETYTRARHQGVLALAGLELTDGLNDRRELLRHWMVREMRHHWGSNTARTGQQPYQPTPYRVALGYSDEHGSISFSQLLYGNRFGANPCTVHEEGGLNIYDPEGNMNTFVVHTGANRTGARPCEGGMHRAYIREEDDQQRLGLAYNVSGTAVSENIDNLVGYRHGNGDFVAIDLSAPQDAY